MGSNPRTESNYKTAVNSKNKMQMLCMRPGTTAGGYNQGREPKNSMHSSTESATNSGHGPPKWYRKKELVERSPMLPRTSKMMAGNDGNSPEKLTVNSTRGFERRMKVGRIFAKSVSGAQMILNVQEQRAIAAQVCISSEQSF
ncbi:hypothetical protein F511_12619 [Dorcoceras hygrometricum]|uniref:Uncharacterized protein n=1 Tax=Dorcoceras hygrometricum TaxID=472368 RepID=A0A2Z7BJF4_9LAMI|nr:hypothetical protein F511_12619 [Dorcoceras hygrometricum]